MTQKTCVKILKQLFASGSVIIGEYSPRLRLGEFEYSPIINYPGVQRFSGVRVLGGDKAEKTSGRDLSNFITMT
jgi:hypothetical protein